MCTIKSTRPLALLSALIAAAAVHVGVSYGQEHAGIAPFITPGVEDVAYVDLRKIDFPAILDQLEQLKLAPAEELAEARKQAQTIQDLFNQLLATGARRAYVLLQASDILHGGPAWLIETENPEQTAAVIQWLKPQLEKLKTAGDIAAYLPTELAARDSFVVAARPERLKEFTSGSRGAARPEALAALAGLDAEAGLVIFGSADGRRVIREMFPQMPAPFMEIDGKLLADGVAWVAISLKLPPQPKLSVSVEATRPEVAATLQQSLQKALELAKGYLMMEMVSGPPAHKERAAQLLPLMPLLKAEVAGNCVSFTFGDDDEEIGFLAKLLPALTLDVREDFQRDRRMNQFKQIALAMHNYLSVHKSFPPAASRDADGRPLLSWRVLVLPYLDQTELYKQFHLDEPWDSEHNRQLIDQMPEVYSDPSSEVRAAVGDRSRTTYVVPVGEKTIFGGEAGMKISQITDGTSATILVAEAAPKQAVIWTKPDDWNVDLSNPLAGVKSDDRAGFVAAYADGSARSLSTENAPSLIKALLTATGGETINFHELK
ncbi:MAG: DUF1559 domain-containing protein [Pirellulales bacterium]|nr:DUF1559 domain-containing protein [Pirellulales bacterium]